MTVQVYLDTSALVKRYIAEAGSNDMAELLKGSEYQAASVVTEAELPAALGKAWRTGVSQNVKRRRRYVPGRRIERIFCGSNFRRILPGMAVSWLGKTVCGDTMRYIWRQRYGGKPILESRLW